MLERISIQNFAVARSVTVDLGQGVNVFTGETGAGKSLVVDALSFVFGARRGREVITTGADRATVVATFDDGSTVERTVGLSGRSSAKLNGLAASLDVLLALGGEHLELHGQTEQLSVLRPTVQLAVLDTYASCETAAATVAAKVRELREVRRALASLVADARERERRIEQLRFEAGEIEAAGLRPGEEEDLRAEQLRLSSTSRRLEDASVALAALESVGSSEALRAIESLAARDPEAAPLLDAATLLDSTVADLKHEVRRYSDGIEDDPERLEAIAERLDLLGRLRRKYGETVDDVIAYGRSATEELVRLTGAGFSSEEFRAREDRLRSELGPLVTELSLARRAAAGRLVAAVGTELEHLGMAGAALGVGFACQDDDAGISTGLPDYEIIAPGQGPGPIGDERLLRAVSETGVDRVEFLASFNLGESPRPLGTVASGGETSRFLLALTTVLGSSAAPRTVVLDEVDEGVGGRSGRLVGEALRRLAGHHQVLCITHLPQVAAYGDRHFVVTKRTDGSRTWSEIHQVDGAERVDEIASMLGGASDANRAAARDLLALGAAGV